jgi:hypothetical protein
LVVVLLLLVCREQQRLGIVDALLTVVVQEVRVVGLLCDEYVAAADAPRVVEAIAQVDGAVVRVLLSELKQLFF